MATLQKKVEIHLDL